jgi:ABC-type multidrug transport system fused ATPase/permease subunit
MRKQLGSITTITIAHRLSTIKEADRILVLQKGAIVEDGTHSSLLKQNPGGLYAKLVSQQEEIDNNAMNSHSINPDDHHEGGEPEGPVDPEVKLAKQKMSEADELDKKRDETTMSVLADIEDANKQKAIFKEKIGEYNKPLIYSIAGLILALILGAVTPVMGCMMIKCVWSMLGLTAANHGNAIRVMGKWVIVLLCGTIYIFIVTALKNSAFGYVSENITMNMRRDVYTSVLRKHMGWHDVRTNNSGVITAILSRDCGALQGLTAEVVGMYLECFGCMGAALAIAFYFSWPMAIIGAVICPLMIVGEMLAVGASTGVSRSDKKAEADLLCSDAIANFKTVASFGCDNQIVSKYHELNQEPFEDDSKDGHKHAIKWGVGNLIVNIVYAVLYYISAQLYYHYPKMSSEDIWLAQFAIMFACMNIGNATQFGPDAGRALGAAIKIFKITNTPTYIDPLAENKNEAQIDKKVFRGEIEFRDVWFRYPTRKEQWVLKGLNLKINAKDNIAIVGESGQGKSTLISLIMRFYDPDFGQVLIDGVDIKQYNVGQLRERMGLVMQEPTLFNYSVKENILYGNMHASNKEIKIAADIANASEFIEDHSLEKQFDETAASLKEAFESETYKAKMIE